MIAISKIIRALNNAVDTKHVFRVDNPDAPNSFVEISASIRVVPLGKGVFWGAKIPNAKASYRGFIRSSMEQAFPNGECQLTKKFLILKSQQVVDRQKFILLAFALERFHKMESGGGL